jgi:hypothetical protein
MSDPDLAPAVADQITFDGFVGWAEVSLGLPPEAAAAAAAAAYRQTCDAYKAAMRNVDKQQAPGIPRSLFRMLLLHFKLELQKHVMRMEAEAASARTPAKKGGATLPARSSHPAFDPLFRGIGDKFQGSRVQREGQAAAAKIAAAKEIEAILQSSGIYSEDCHKVAAALVDAGASDLRSMVQLLQQDNLTLSRAGLLPSHVLRVLRNMAKQPAFAAEAPSFRLTWSDD